MHLEECARTQQLAQVTPAGDDQYGTLYAALEGTLAGLPAAAARRAAMLAVFPEDTAVPAP